ncbi:homoserine kinase [Sporosarcina sp. NCCP-2716]|uniref:homoserine kinase n=1 Tax=Sporosarcina sp. NCCP-2716 TaxID=2943679 RepID=UPI002041E48C|nr:homoserine kinase [Sporosarcina sp. NCCP-2716]GKV70436.1 homoserine kinase [Sporosarcina sp. NCCP-2716]
MGGPITVRVPATTANLGPGFDSIAMALSLWMTVGATPADRWSVVYEDEAMQGLPTDDTNLIVQTIGRVVRRAGKKDIPCTLRVTSDIPLGKGLGSSAAAIAAGIEIADRLHELQLKRKEKMWFGASIEGHADNVTAAIAGGVTVSFYDGSSLEVLAFDAPDIGGVVLVPPVMMKTGDSRGLLPAQLDHKKATEGSAASSLMAAALATGDWPLVGRMMDRDIFHEPYRKDRFPDFDKIREASHKHGAYGMTLSGAGPSLFLAVPAGREDEIARTLETAFPYYKAIAVRPVVEGSSGN